MSFIKPREDPFKKYWWLILFGCLVVGIWVCFPFLGSSGGASIPLAEGGPKAATQSLNSLDGSGMAPGSPLGKLGAYAKKAFSNPFASLLYQAPAEKKSEVAPSKAINPAAQLSQIAGSSSSGGSASPYMPSPQGGASFAPMGGLGDMGGGGESGVSGNAGGPGVFGESEAKTKIVDSAQPNPAAAASETGAGQAMNALKNAQTSSSEGAASGFSAKSAALSGQSFDNGSSGGPQLAGGPGTTLPSLGSGDTAANLKDLNPRTAKEPALPPPTPQQTKDKSQPNNSIDLKTLLLETLITTVVGGLASGVTSGVLGAVGLPVTGGSSGSNSNNSSSNSNPPKT